MNKEKEEIRINLGETIYDDVCNKIYNHPDLSHLEKDAVTMHVAIAILSFLLLDKPDKSKIKILNYLADKAVFMSVEMGKAQKNGITQ